MRDSGKFEKTIRDKRNRILEEPLIMTYIAPLRRRMQEQVNAMHRVFVSVVWCWHVHDILQAILNLIKPFKDVSLAYLAQELTLSVPEIESLLVDLLADERLAGAIDQMQARLIVKKHVQSKEHQMFATKYELVENWISSINNIKQELEYRLSGEKASMNKGGLIIV